MQIMINVGFTLYVPESAKRLASIKTLLAFATRMLL